MIARGIEQLSSWRLAKHSCAFCMCICPWESKQMLQQTCCATCASCVKPIIIKKLPPKTSNSNRKLAGSSPSGCACLGDLEPSRHSIENAQELLGWDLRPIKVTHPDLTMASLEIPKSREPGNEPGTAAEGDTRRRSAGGGAHVSPAVAAPPPRRATPRAADRMRQAARARRPPPARRRIDDTRSRAHRSRARAKMARCSPPRTRERA